MTSDLPSTPPLPVAQPGLVADPASPPPDRAAPGQRSGPWWRRKPKRPETRAARRALAYARLREETGVPDADLRHLLDRFRADDCSFLVPPPSAVPALAADTRVDVGHEALLRRWERLSGDPVSPAGGASDIRQIGWLRAEDAAAYPSSADSLAIT